MRQRMIGITCIMIGSLMGLFWLSALPAPHVVAAAPLLQPSPRPPIDDTSSDEGSSSTVAPPGRITGTVIDQTTGAPAPGINVNVGGVIVVSDANGNYDRYVPAGIYTVTLALAPNQGAPIVAYQTTQVQSNQVTVLHMSFTSSIAPAPQPATPAPPPTAMPAPTAEPAGVSGLPNQLPVTGVMPVPKRLPVTGDEQPLEYSPFWLLSAALLVAIGILLMIRPARRVLASAGRATSGNDPLLKTLLDNALLAELLKNGSQKRRKSSEE